MTRNCEQTSQLGDLGKLGARALHKGRETAPEVVPFHCRDTIVTKALSHSAPSLWSPLPRVPHGGTQASPRPRVPQRHPLCPCAFKNCHHQHLLGRVVTPCLDASHPGNSSSLTGAASPCPTPRLTQQHTPGLHVKVGISHDAAPFLTPQCGRWRGQEVETLVPRALPTGCYVVRLEGPQNGSPRSKRRIQPSSNHFCGQTKALKAGLEGHPHSLGTAGHSSSPGGAADNGQGEGGPAGRPHSLRMEGNVTCM